jgi:hypothetical protein
MILSSGIVDQKVAVFEEDKLPFSPRQKTEAQSAAISDATYQPRFFREGSSNAIQSTISDNWGVISSSGMSVALFDRLVRLSGSRDGWHGPGSLSLSGKSLRAFLAFWSLIRSYAVEPEMALAPDGTLNAVWYRGMKQQLDTRFVDGNVVFGLFSGNSILEGTDKTAIVADLLLSHPAKPLTWSPK